MVGFYVGLGILLFILIASTLITYAMSHQSSMNASQKDVDVCD
jgi:hypothetical protein